MATISRLVIEISANISSLTKSLAGATSSVASFVGRTAKQLAAIGTVVALALTGAAILIGRSLGAAADNVDKLSKAAEKVNVPLRELQKLDFAASLADVAPETLIRSLQFLGKNIFETAKNGGELTEVFRRLGLSVQTLNKMTADQQFRAVADALNKVTNAGERTNLQMQLFGRGGLELTNLILSSLKLSDDLFSKLGLGLTDAQGKAVEAFNDSKTVIGSIFDGFKESVAANVAPAFTAINEAITQTVIDMGGVKTIAQEVGIAIVQMSIDAVKAFAALSKLVIDVGTALDNIGIQFAELLAKGDRFNKAVRGVSIEGKKDLIDTSIVKGAGVDTFNTIVKVSEAWGEAIFNMTHASEQQLKEEDAIRAPALARFAKNNVEAAEKLKKLEKGTGDLVTALEKTKRELENPQAAAKRLPGQFQGTDTGLGKTAKVGGIGSAERGFSLDPALNQLMKESSQREQLIHEQQAEAQAIRDFFALKLPDNAGPTRADLDFLKSKRADERQSTLSSAISNQGGLTNPLLGPLSDKALAVAEQIKPPQILQIEISEAATTPIVQAILDNMIFKLGVGELVLENTNSTAKSVAQ